MTIKEDFLFTRSKKATIKFVGGRWDGNTITYIDGITARQLAEMIEGMLSYGNKENTLTTSNTDIDPLVVTRKTNG